MYTHDQALTAAYSETMGEEELLTSLREMQFFMTGRNNDERGYLLTGEDTYPNEMQEKGQGGGSSYPSCGCSSH